MDDWVRAKNWPTHYSTNIGGPMTVLTKSARILQMTFPILFLCNYSIVFKLFSIFSMQRRIQGNFDTADAVLAPKLWRPKVCSNLKWLGSHLVPWRNTKTKIMKMVFMKIFSQLFMKAYSQIKSSPQGCRNWE